MHADAPNQGVTNTDQPIASPVAYGGGGGGGAQDDGGLGVVVIQQCFVRPDDGIKAEPDLFEKQHQMLESAELTLVRTVAVAPERARQVPLVAQR